MKHTDIIESMRSDTLSNYIVPGLSSSLLENGKVRLFDCSRNHQESIVPHSHRFDFASLVLCGKVVNKIWTSTTESSGDFFEETYLRYGGKPGSYMSAVHGRDFYNYRSKTYEQGKWYVMKSDDIHSIEFERGTKVLVFEGPQITNTSTILEPVVNGKKIPTHVVEDWMFQSEANNEFNK